MGARLVVDTSVEGEYRVPKVVHRVAPGVNAARAWLKSMVPPRALIVGKGPYLRMTRGPLELVPKTSSVVPESEAVIAGSKVTVALPLIRSVVTTRSISQLPPVISASVIAVALARIRPEPPWA